MRVSRSWLIRGWRLAVVKASPAPPLKALRPQPGGPPAPPRDPHTFSQTGRFSCPPARLRSPARHPHLLLSPPAPTADVLAFFSPMIRAGRPTSSRLIPDNPA